MSVLRVVIVSAAGPESVALIDEHLRALRHEPLAWLTVPAPPDQIVHCASGCPAEIDFMVASRPESVLPLVRAHEPDLLLCWGFP